MCRLIEMVGHILMEQMGDQWFLHFWWKIVAQMACIYVAAATSSPLKSRSFLINLFIPNLYYRSLIWRIGKSTWMVEQKVWMKDVKYEHKHTQFDIIFSMSNFVFIKMTLSAIQRLNFILMVIVPFNEWHSFVRWVMQLIFEMSSKREEANDWWPMNTMLILHINCCLILKTSIFQSQRISFN